MTPHQTQMQQIDMTKDKATQQINDRSRKQ